MIKAKNSVLKYLFIILIAFGCSNSEPFTIEKWNFKEDIFYVKRKYLVDDLTVNHLKNLCRDDIIRLLGVSDTRTSFIAKNELYYELETKYGIDIDPKWIKYLVIKLDKNGCFKKTEILKLK